MGGYKWWTLFVLVILDSSNIGTHEYKDNIEEFNFGSRRLVTPGL